MGKLIRQFDEETSVVTDDLYLLQKASGNAYKSIKASNLIPDGTLTAAKFNFDESSGSPWEPLAQVTLQSSADEIEATFSTRKHLLVLFNTVTSGSVNSLMTFNSDAGSRYADRQSTNGAADATTISQTAYTIIGAASSRPIYTVMHISNITGYEKIIWEQRVDPSASGAGTAPQRKEAVGKWANTTEQINTITITNGSTGDYSPGTQLYVWGKD